MNPVLYAALCLIVPIAWGLVVVWLSNRIEGAISRRRAGANRKSLPPTEYHI